MRTTTPTLASGLLIFSRWNSASSTDELPCSSVDCEFWQSQNIASVITTAILGGTERRVCLQQTSRIDVCAFRARIEQLPSSHFVQLFNFKGDLPIVDVPTDKEYYRRKLIKEYKTLKGDRRREINRLHALFVQCGITTIKWSNVQTDVNRQDVLPQLFDYEAGQAKRLCERLTMLEAQIEELEQLIKKGM